MRHALLADISRIQRHQVELIKKLKAGELSDSPVGHTPRFWRLASDSVLGSFDWDPKPTREMFAALSLPVPPEDDALALETRIQQIRESLSPYPNIPDPSAPRLLSLETHQTAPARVTTSQVAALSTQPRSIKRKSIRFSMAQKGRPSLFRVVDHVTKYLRKSVVYSPSHSLAC